MKRVLPVVVLAILAASAVPTVAVDSAAIKAQFAHPPRQFASAPLWVWNDRLTEEQVRGTLRDLAGQKVMQAFVHPRPGLMTPYLSPEWFKLWKVALDEAEKLDMNIWIYDENSYPSGFAGGLVPEAMPDSRGKGLVAAEVKMVEKPDADVLAVFRLTDSGSENVTAQARGGQSLPAGRYLVFRQQLAPVGGWFGGKYYVDLLKPGVTEKFIEITHEAYRREIGSQFGKRMPGIFTDEPHLTPAGTMHWSDNLEAEFQKRWGYSLVDQLPSLVRPVGDWRRVRHDYQQLLLDLFIEHWSKPNSEYCAKHGLEWTGHYWEHGWPGASHGPDNMAMYAWHQRPAIDILMNQYSEDVHAQFGNARAVKELSSAANQLGKQRTLCEAYGAGGWDLRFEDMKRIGDWLLVLGVNTLDEHLSYITLRGARKRDHPQSFSYHEPWWDSYHVLAEYFTRLSLVMSSGQQVNKILVLEPTTTAWMYQNDPSHADKLKHLGDQFQGLLNMLERAQVEYDIGCEDIIARHGSVEGKQFVVGERKYDFVVLPPLMENLNGKTMDLLEKYSRAHGGIISVGTIPSLIDGRPSDRAKKCAERCSPNWSNDWQLGGLRDELTTLTHFSDKFGGAGPSGPLFVVTSNEGDRGILFHHRRQLDDGQVLLLVNTSIESPSAGAVTATAQVVEEWDLGTGKCQPCPFKFAHNDNHKPGTLQPLVRAEFNLPPCGSLVLFFAKDKPKAAPAARPQQPGPMAVVQPSGPMKIRRVEPNVLTLDFVDITVGSESKNNVYFYQANQMAFQRNGMERNPWDSAVQLRDGLITQKFPPDSGFEATYHFTVEGQVPKRLEIVIERPDLYAIACNGQLVAAAKDSWWLDKVFGRIDLAAAAKPGENAVTIKARPMTIYHEIEPAYLLGDFRLKATEKGFAVVPEEPLALGPWNEQGHPMYAAGVAYAQTYNVAQPGGRFCVRMPKWYGSVAKVTVNGRPVGHVFCPPWQCDVSEAITPGANTVEVVVIGTLKNTLGPHHGKPTLGTAWPRMFQIGPETGPPPGRQYHTVGYGLMAPFVLERAER